MDEMSLTKTRLVGGVWEGELRGAGENAPQLLVSHLGEQVDGLIAAHNPQDESWTIRVPIPVERVADGVQTFLISDATTGTQLASFTFIAGEPLAEDIRAEMDLLREELDMLKKAFRRHCLETM